MREKEKLSRQESNLRGAFHHSAHDACGERRDSPSECSLNTSQRVDCSVFVMKVQGKIRHLPHVLAARVRGLHEIRMGDLAALRDAEGSVKPATVAGLDQRSFSHDG